MAITVGQQDLKGGAQLADGLDRLVVLGVDWTRTPESAAARGDDDVAGPAEGEGGQRLRNIAGHDARAAEARRIGKLRPALPTSSAN